MPDELSRNPRAIAPGRSTFAAPGWLRDLGLTSWFLIGCFALLAGAAWVLGTAATIVGPVVVAMIIATVSIPLVGWLHQHRVPRAAGAAIVLLGLVVIAAVIVVLVIGGITGQRAEIGENANAAAAHGEAWLKSLGVDQSGASGASASAKNDVPKIIATLVKGVISGLQGITSLVFGLSLAACARSSCSRTGLRCVGWVDRHLGVPLPVGQTITGGVIRSLRGYFRGVTIVAVFNGNVVALGALVLGVPLAGTIGVVTFVTAYVPFVGAFVAGAFAVVIALGAPGHVDRADHARDRLARERASPEHPAAVRDGIGARPQPARRARRHDRSRLPVRDVGARACRAAHLGGGSHLAGAGRGACGCRPRRDRDRARSIAPARCAAGRVRSNDALGARQPVGTSRPTWTVSSTRPSLTATSIASLRDETSSFR